MSKNTSQPTAGKAGMLISDSSPFQVKEAFKTVRSNLLFTLATTDSKAFTVSSPLPSEGKSTSCANLAIAFAQTGAQVLLIDCDLRKPMVHRLFRLSNDRGVTSVLCGANKIEEALHQDVKPNLDVMPAGPLSPNPSELLGSAQMSELLSIVQKAYDYVILDTPPVNVVSDALIVSQQTAGVVLILRQNQSRHDQLKKALESCEMANVNVMGLVVNDVKAQAGGYYKYKYKYNYDYSTKA